jgi:hypothetical protein
MEVPLRPLYRLSEAGITVDRLYLLVTKVTNVWWAMAITNFYAEVAVITNDAHKMLRCFLGSLPDSIPVARPGQSVSVGGA